MEAARAGEQGRGFALVATEVRSLAQRSASAAREIKALIGASVEKVESGSALVQQAGTMMDEIVVGIRRVSDVIGEISAANQEQRNDEETTRSVENRLNQIFNSRRYILSIVQQYHLYDHLVGKTSEQKIADLFSGALDRRVGDRGMTEQQRLELSGRHREQPKLEARPAGQHRERGAGSQGLGVTR